MTNIKNLGYTTPTPIQTRAIPSAMEGRDLMGLAQTGTGKTAAFLLPIINKLMKKPQVAGAPRRAYRRPRCLVLAPTRELAEQIHESALDLGRNTGIRSTTVYGGVNMGRQISALRNGSDIVVACPGRLLDHMGQRTVDLSMVEVLVLDEADQMFDMGFLPDIKKILAGLPRARQTMLFSATMPEAIRSLATDILKDPETVSVGHSAPAETVSHAIYPVAHHLKTQLLLAMLDRNGKDGSYLVFTRTKHRAKRLAENLEKLGHKAAALQGNLSQNRRKETMDGFRSGRFRIMVATDIAARGIDVSLVSHVVNFDVPSTPETYTHRIGRTGRAERTGEAHTFVTAEDMSMVRAIERLLREPLTRKKLDGFDYNELPSAADKDFNRPIMDRRGGFGQRGARPQAPYGADARGDRSSSSYGRKAKYGALRSDKSDEAPAGGFGSQPGDDIYSPDRGDSRRDGRNAGAPRRDARPEQGRGQGGFQPRGESAPQGAHPGRRQDSRPEGRPTGDARAAKPQGHQERAGGAPRQQRGPRPERRDGQSQSR